MTPASGLPSAKWQRPKVCRGWGKWNRIMGYWHRCPGDTRGQQITRHPPSLIRHPDTEFVPITIWEFIYFTLWTLTHTHAQLLGRCPCQLFISPRSGVASPGLAWWPVAMAVSRNSATSSLHEVTLRMSLGCLPLQCGVKPSIEHGGAWWLDVVPSTLPLPDLITCQTKSLSDQSNQVKEDQIKMLTLNTPILFIFFVVGQISCESFWVNRGELGVVWGYWGTNLCWPRVSVQWNWLRGCNGPQTTP